MLSGLMVVLCLLSSFWRMALKASSVLVLAPKRRKEAWVRESNIRRWVILLSNYLELNYYQKIKKCQTPHKVYIQYLTIKDIDHKGYLRVAMPFVANISAQKWTITSLKGPVYRNYFIF